MVTYERILQIRYLPIAFFVTSLLSEGMKVAQASEALRRQLTDENPRTSLGSSLYPDDQKFSKEIDLETAESLLWKNNLLLIASRFQIDVKKAGILQAGLYANPNIAIDQSVYAEPTQRYFDTTRSGQSVVQVQQVFLLGGKIDKRVKVAELNAKISEQEFYDLTRALITKLRRTFYTIYFYKKAVVFYDQSIASIEKTVESSELAYKRRALLQAEHLRLKALLFFLKKEREDLAIKVYEKEAELKVLVNDDLYRDARVEFVPKINERQLDAIIPNTVKLEDLVEIARENRPDLKKPYKHFDTKKQIWNYNMPMQYLIYLLVQFITEVVLPSKIIGESPHNSVFHYSIGTKGISKLQKKQFWSANKN